MHHPTLLILLPLLATLLHDTTHADCEPAACGTLTVKYPFWLGGSNQSSSSCGHPAFQVWCSDDGSVTSLRGSAIHVLGIDYANNSFITSHARVAAANGVCGTDFNMTSSIALSPFTISRRNRALCFLYNCNGTVPRGHGFVNATSGCKSGAIYAYLGGSYYWDSPPAIETSRCAYAYFPVRGYEAVTAVNYSRLLKDGFVLEWETAAIGDCPACSATGGQCRYDNAAAVFACLCPDGKLLAGSRCAGSKRTTRKLVLIGAGSLLLPCIYVLMWHRRGKRLYFFLCKKIGSSNERNIEALILSHGLLAPKRYKYSEATKITSSLNNKLGEGGYGVVFKGRLPDDRLVAVKFLHDLKANGEEFVKEVMSIGRTSHVNIVGLFGLCLEGSKQALIYEYMSNSSLDKYIYSENPKAILEWERLYAIAIVHFDIKPQNILLDQNVCPKIADFGLAKLNRTKESKLSMTGARGTIRFITPEVHSQTFGVVSTKSDVYSYGMMLLEMVGGRKNVKSAVENFAQDNRLQACGVTQEVEEIAKKMTLIGLWCIQILPMHRPTITKVLEMFERGLDELVMLPKQNFSQILEDSVYNLNAESTNANSPTKTQPYSEVLKMKEISLANSKILRRLPTL